MVDNRDYKMETKKDPLQCGSILTRAVRKGVGHGAVLHRWVLISSQSSFGERQNSKIEVGVKT